MSTQFNLEIKIASQASDKYKAATLYITVHGAVTMADMLAQIERRLSNFGIWFEITGVYTGSAVVRVMPEGASNEDPGRKELVSLMMQRLQAMLSPTPHKKSLDEEIPF